MEKPPDHTAEQADICCELGVVLPPRMQFFPIYQKLCPVNEVALRRVGLVAYSDW